MASRQEQAAEYLADHRLPELFEDLTSQLVFHRPEDPRAFLAEYMGQLIKQRKGDADAQVRPLIDAASARAVFRSFDPTGRGFITVEQYHAAMNTLLVKSYNHEPKGFVEGRIQEDAFVQECSEAVKVVV